MSGEGQAASDVVSTSERAHRIQPDNPQRRDEARASRRDSHQQERRGESHRITGAHLI